MRLAFIAFAIGLPLTASAQDVGPALDMGQLTGTLAQDHVRWSESQRAGGGTSPRARSARQASACGNLPNFRSQYGANHPKVVRLAQLCRRAGY